MKEFNKNQGRSKEQVKANEQVGTAAFFLFVLSFVMFIIINALANG